MKTSLKETIANIVLPDEAAILACKENWDKVAKPLRSLGKLEDVIAQVAGIQRTPQVHIQKKGLIIMCADNGVVEEGVTQSGQEVTAVVAENFLDEKSCVAIMCKQAGVDLYPIDIGMAVDTPRVEKRKIAYGTKNFAKEPAMTREEAVAAIEVGIAKATELIEEGYEVLAIGEMGIGNTTTSSAIASVLLDLEPEIMTGRGAGLNDVGYQKKISVIKEAIKYHKPDREDPIDVLSKVGGFDIAGMAGVCLAAAANHTPLVMDGLISAVAALIAIRLAPNCADYIVGSHRSDEPAVVYLLDALGKKPCIDAGMRVGEGTGAIAFMPLLDMAERIYSCMATFDNANIEQYEDYTKK